MTSNMEQIKGGPFSFSLKEIKQVISAQHLRAFSFYVQ